MEGKTNINRLAEVLSAILSDKYDMKITITFRPKDSVNNADALEVSAIEE